MARRVHTEPQFPQGERATAKGQVAARNRQHRDEEGGVLFLGVNDFVFGDNDGAFVVAILKAS